MTPSERIAYIKRELHMLSQRDAGVAHVCRHVLTLVEEVARDQETLGMRLDRVTRELRDVQRHVHPSRYSDLSGLAAREHIPEFPRPIKEPTMPPRRPRRQHSDAPPYRRQALPGAPQTRPGPPDAPPPPYSPRKDPPPPEVPDKVKETP